MSTNIKSEYKKAEKILDYWFTLEFLAQDAYPNHRMAKKELAAYKRRADKNYSTIKFVQDYKDAGIDLYEDIKNETRQLGMKARGKISVYIGAVRREACIDAISKALPYDVDDNERIEKNTDFIALASVQLKSNGEYEEGSLSLSTILWAMNQLSRRSKNLSQSLDKENYDKDLRELEEKYFKVDGKNATDDGDDSDTEEPDIGSAVSTEAVTLQHLQRLYNEIVEIYIKKNHSAEFDKFECYEVYGVEVQLFKGNDGKDENDYLGLSHDYFSNDIKLVLDKVRKGEDVPYELIEYITCLTDENRKAEKRFDIVHMSKNEREQLNQLNKILHIKNSPDGKWPSRFQPAFMQQVAVNMGSPTVSGKFAGEPYGTVFSVNGPPGTGKTTLLKEIVVNNVVERAKLLAKYDKPDDAFEICDFKHGNKTFKQGNAYGRAYSKYVRHWYKLKDDRINDYGILVTSCNNAAVENISKELPKSMQGDLNPLKDDSDELRSMLKEVSDLFDVEASGVTEHTSKGDAYKDIYFTKYARELLDNDTAWGLIAAPLGKKSNIKPFYKKVVRELRWNFYGNSSMAEQRLASYRRARADFLRQLDVVSQMKSDVGRVCDLLEEKSNLRVNIPLIGKIIEKYKLGKLNKSYEESLRVFKDNDLDKAPVLDEEYMSRLYSDDISASTKAQVDNPWFTQRYNREREKLFALAIRLNKEFVLSTNHCKDNLVTLAQYWGLELGDDKEEIKFHKDDKQEMVASLYQTLFLYVPVISSTFASIGSLLRDVKEPGVIGTLIVDESGQAQPQMAVGALYKSRRAVIVGDPKQVEPVVTDDLELLKKAYTDEVIMPYREKTISVQSFADSMNLIGTYLDNGSDYPDWVGSPLLVHRRCISPMYDISNEISYGGIMKQQTAPPKASKKFVRQKSEWINVVGAEKGNKNHFVEAQAEKVCEILEEAFAISDEPNIYIISPFKSVVEGIRSYIGKYCDMNAQTKIRKDHILSQDTKRIGTVHTFQGKEADEVIFLLGCDDSPGASGAVKWVNPNIVNVAATRAKYRLYVIGDEDVWKNSACVSKAMEIMGRF